MVVFVAATTGNRVGPGSVETNRKPCGTSLSPWRRAWSVPIGSTTPIARGSGRATLGKFWARHPKPCLAIACGRLKNFRIFIRKTILSAVTIFSAMARDYVIPRPSEPVTNPIDWSAELARHGRWLRTVVVARVGDPWAVDDVLQEIAAAAVRNGHQLRDTERCGPWLYRLAVVSALQYRRRQGRGRKLVERFTRRCPPVEADQRELDPLDWLLADEQKMMVRQALSCLPRRDAEILLLKYTEDWSYGELAEHLGLTTSAVEARLHRARQKMRRGLGRLDRSFETARQEV